MIRLIFCVLSLIILSLLLINNPCFNGIGDMFMVIFYDNNKACIVALNIIIYLSDNILYFIQQYTFIVTSLFFVITIYIKLVT